MTDELCAREGCGAPKAWHDRASTVDELAAWPDNAKRNGNHIHVYPFRFPPYSHPEDSCLSFACYCTGYLAPPPEAELKAYVFESSVATRMPSGTWALPSGHVVTALDEYLAAHPQPAPALCICGGREDEHDDERHLCRHASFFGDWVTHNKVRTECRCEYYVEAQP